MPDPSDEDHENAPDTARAEDREDDSYVVVHGGEELVRDYGKMSEDIVWCGEENFTELANGDHMEEEEAMIDRVVVSHNGDMIQWYYQVVATGPGSDLDKIMARKENPSQHEPADMDDDRGRVDKPVTREGHDIPTGVVQPEVEEVADTAIARNAKYHFDIGEQMPH